MATEVRLRRGTTAQHAAFTGAAAEVTVDTDKKTAVVHDGATPGGFPLLRADATAGQLAIDIHSATAKTTPVDADEFGIWDSVSGLLCRLTWANLKATLSASTMFATNIFRLRDSTDQTKLLAFDLSGIPTGTTRTVKVPSSLLPKGHIYGLTLSNNATDGVNDIDIAAGEAASSESSPDLMVLASAMTKRLDATWAAGSGQGGMNVGDTLADTTYHVHLIKNLTSGAVDVIFSTNPTAPFNIPAGYTVSRRIGSILRAAGTIRAFFQSGDFFLLSDTVIEYNSGSARALSALALSGAPQGIVTRPILTVRNLMTAAGDILTYVAPTVSSTVQLITRTGLAGAADNNTIDFISTTTNREVFFQVSVLGGSGSVVVNSKGWIDSRGRNG